MSEDHSRNKLNALQPSNLSRSQQVLHHRILDGWVGCQLGKIGVFIRNPEFLDKCTKRILLRNDNGNGPRRFRRRKNTNIIHQSGGPIRRFKLSSASYKRCTFSRAIYSPFNVLTRFLIRSMIDNGPDSCHCPTSPVLNHPSSVNDLDVSSSFL